MWPTLYFLIKFQLNWFDIFLAMIWNIFIWSLDNLRFIAIVRCLKFEDGSDCHSEDEPVPGARARVWGGGKYQHHINNTNWQINDHCQSGAEPNIGQNYTGPGRHGRCYINKHPGTTLWRDSGHHWLRCVDTAPAEPAVPVLQARGWETRSHRLPFRNAASPSLFMFHISTLNWL